MDELALYLVTVVKKVLAMLIVRTKELPNLFNYKQDTTF